MAAEGLKEGPKLIPMAIQDEGGVSKTVMRATGFLKELLPEANNVKREAIPASELMYEYRPREASPPATTARRKSLPPASGWDAWSTVASHPDP